MRADRSRMEHMDTIRFTVEGRPPAKSGRSIFGQRSNHHARLLALLAEAHRAKSAAGFRGFADSPVRLEVEVHSPPGQPGDATNFLGGIADALEVKRLRVQASGPLTHLGYRQHVGVYDNDRQIKEIRYAEKESATVGYTVTVIRLP